MISVLSFGISVDLSSVILTTQMTERQDAALEVLLLPATVARAGGCLVLPNRTAITSHQLANGVNCHTQGGPQLTVCLKPMHKLI